jgi:hypothetical protein
MSFDSEEISRELKRVTLVDVIVTTVETSTTSVSVTDSPPQVVAPPDHSPHGARDSVDAEPAPDDATADESAKLAFCSEDATSESPTLRPNPLSLPLTIRKIYDIAGARTVLHIQLFADRTLLTCSQLPEGSIASWLLCKPAISMAPAAYQRSSSGSSSNRGNNNTSIDLDVLPLLGAARDDEVVVYTVLAKQIFGTLPVERREMPILLGLGLPRLVASAPAGADGGTLFFHTIAHLMGSLYLSALGP